MRIDRREELAEFARKALVTHRSERSALLERVTRSLADDGRVLAVWLSGSLGRGTADDLSDLDLAVVVDDEECEALAATAETRRAFVSYMAGVVPVVLGEEPQNRPPGGAYLGVLYAGQFGPHRVDWYWHRRSTATLPPDETRVLFDRARLPRSNSPPRWDYQLVPDEAPAELAARRCGRFWGMLCITAKYLARSPFGDPAESLEWVYEPLNALERFAGIEETPGEDAAPDRAPTRAQAIASVALLRRLAERMERLIPRLASLGVAVPEAGAAEQAYRYLEMIEAVVGTSGGVGLKDT